jgi:hypothetical protein
VLVFDSREWYPQSVQPIAIFDESGGCTSYEGRVDTFSDCLWQQHYCPLLEKVHISHHFVEHTKEVARGADFKLDRGGGGADKKNRGQRGSRQSYLNRLASRRRHERMCLLSREKAEPIVDLCNLARPWLDPKDSTAVVILVRHQHFRPLPFCR